MPIEKTIQTANSALLIIWNINESLDELKQLFALHAHRFQVSESTPTLEHKHWLASRLAILMSYPDSKIDLHKDELNKPYLKINRQNFAVSLSHSFDKAAVIIHPTHTCGIDIERIDTRLDRVASKFMTDNEWSILPLQQKTEWLTTFWSAKETMYKIWGKKSLDFRKNILINTILSNTLHGTIQTPNVYYSLTISFFKTDEYIITYAVSDIVSTNESFPAAYIEPHIGQSEN